MTNARPFGINRIGAIAMALVAVFAIATVFLTRPQTASFSLSPVSGLMSLKALAQDAVPYDLAMANAKPTVIELYADWCTTCQALAPSMQSLHDELGGQVNFVMLNIDDPQWSRQIQQFHATGVPQLNFLLADQTVVDTMVGKVPKSILMQRLQMLIS
ncbi:MAG: thioredoxin domain-containing protein [Leptolyngbyaceae cyanobacterium MO_188.B28]|nr:thioredoxin domain-containing protein [Leptolyngbyaceae cyanobacterium MO_188.B28]